jgi:tetratricopeptide (TPR) repeat protein
MYLRRDGYTKDSTPKIRVELEKILSLSPDFAPAHAFLSVAYAQDPDKDFNKALNSAIRASNLEPGNLAYLIDIGKAYLAAGRIPEARKVAETAQKLATTSNDRSITTSFVKQIDYKVNHPEEPVSAKSVADEPPANAAAPNSAEVTAHAEGQITELLCRRPPEVLLTLTTAGNSLLLHVSDIANVSIQVGGKPSDATSLPCSRWKDRHAKIDYRIVLSGVAQGEVQVISLE